MSKDTTLSEFTEQQQDDPTSGEELREDGFLTLSRDWSVSTLSEVAKKGGLVDGDWIESDDMDEDGEIQLVQLGHIGQGRFKGEPNRFITKEFAEKEDCTVLSEGDLLISRMQEPILRCCLLPSFEKESVMAVDIARLQESEGWNRQFLKYVLNSRPIWKQGIAWASGTTRKRISRKNMEKLRLPTPSLSEQQKIATILYTIDRAIEKTEQIIEQVDKLKSGVVQQVFTEGTRDHETYQNTKSGKAPEEWELTRFEEVITDTRYGTNTKSNTESDGYPTLRIPNIVNKRVTVDDLKHTPLSEDEIERLKLADGDILVIRTNGNPDYVGRCATFDERDEPFVFASYLIRVRVDKSRVRPAYVREFLNSRRGRSEMAGWIRSSAGNYNLSVGAMEKFQIPIPSLEEQDEMVEKITEVGRTIQTNQQYCNELQRLKRGLMQDLLSGTVRTTDTNIEVPDEIAQHG